MCRIYERGFAYMITNIGIELGGMPEIYLKIAKVIYNVVQNHTVGKVSAMLIESWHALMFMFPFNVHC